MNVGYLVDGEGQKWKGDSLQVKEDDPSWQSESDFILVPRYDVKASAGSGSNIQSEQVVDHLAFKRDWVADMDLQHDHLALISAKGDSMEPTIKNGDLLLVDTRPRETFIEGIYIEDGWSLIGKTTTKHFRWWSDR